MLNITNYKYKRRIKYLAQGHRLQMINDQPTKKNLTSREEPILGILFPNERNRNSGEAPQTKRFVATLKDL